MINMFFRVVYGSSIATATLALLGFAGPTAAGVIYQDNFTGGATTPLSGTTPTIDNGTSLAWFNQWNTAWMANGSVIATSNSDLEVAALDFTPQSGQIYTLSINLNPTSGSNFMSFGFTNGNGSGGPFFNTVGPWMDFWLPNGVTGQAGPGTNNAVFNSTGLVENQVSQIVLNTAGDNWVTQWFYNGSLLGSYTYTGSSGTNPDPTSITEVAIGDVGDVGNVSNFQLSSAPVAVPVPSCIGLMMSGAGLMLLLLRRKKNREIIQRSAL